MNLCHSGNISW